MFSFTAKYTAKYCLRRSLSSSITESPRDAIAKNLLLFNRIIAAKDENSLTAAAKSSVAVDLKELPGELLPYQKYLSSSASSSSVPYVPDPTAWQNLVR